METNEADTSILSPPASLIPAARLPDFFAWALEGGYDESYHNRWDSKSLALQEAYLEETQEEMLNP